MSQELGGGQKRAKKVLRIILMALNRLRKFRLDKERVRF